MKTQPLVAANKSSIQSGNKKNSKQNQNANNQPNSMGNANNQPNSMGNANNNTKPVDKTTGKSTVIITSIVSSVVTLAITFALLAAWVNPMQLSEQIALIEKNNKSVIANNQKIDRILSDLDTASNTMEVEIQEYINRNYGELSHRDEKVEKLVLLYEQQEKRLLNIESALTKF